MKDTKARVELQNQITKSVVDLFMIRNKGYDRQLIEQRIKQQMKNIKGRKDIVKLLNTYRNQNRSIVEVEQIDNLLMFMEVLND